MIDSAGQIDIAIAQNRETGLASVKLGSSRPVGLSKIFIGKGIDELLETIPLVYNLCGVAHSQAALSAIESLLGIEPKQETKRGRGILLLLENLKENLLRVFLDWPRLFGLELQRQPLVRLNDLIKVSKHALFKKGKAFTLNSQLALNFFLLEKCFKDIKQSIETHLLGIRLSEWQQIEDYKALQTWSQSSTQIAAQSVSRIISQGWSSQCFSICDSLPAMEAEELEAMFLSKEWQTFIRQPSWRGRQYETTALSRNLENPLIKDLSAKFNNALLTRWVARLVDISDIMQKLDQLIQGFNNGNYRQSTSETLLPGMASADAARGKLIHFVRLKADKIKDYKVLAPTEWNFHPKGVVYQGLKNMSQGQHRDSRDLAELYIHSIDPCVGFDLRMS